MVLSDRLPNREGISDYDISWTNSDKPLQPGFTAVLRVKNEARSLPYVLPQLFRAVEHVVLVDNQSDDDTVAVAKNLAAEHGATHRLDIRSYPFAVSRCGPEHLSTLPDSVHSLTYFYNWSFSHVRTQYALKWDGDMLLTDEGVRIFRDLTWAIEATEVVVLVPRTPLYIAADRVWADTGIRNFEPWAWPNTPNYRFGKAFEWEVPLQPTNVKNIRLPEGICFELKWLDMDEFSHWSDRNFGQTVRTQRKAREWAIFAALATEDVLPELVGLSSEWGATVDEQLRTLRGLTAAQWQHYCRQALDNLAS